MGMGPWDETWGEAYDDIWGYGAKHGTKHMTTYEAI